MSSASANHNRRRIRVVIERDFQYRLTLRICLIASGIFIAFGGILLFLIKMNYEMLIQNALLQMPEMVNQLQREFRLVSLAIVSAFILMIGVIFGLGIVLTQRLAGPLFAFKRTLKEFADGKTGVRLSLRVGDEFLPLAEIFNYAMESWEQKQRRTENEIRAALASLSAKDSAQASDRLEKLLKPQSPTPAQS